MKNSLKIEVTISLILVILTVLLLNPFHFWMPDLFLICMLAITLVVFALFAAFILREKAGDERDVIHRMLSGRVAYLVGSAFLTLGIVVQASSNDVDVWLVVVLVAMIISKLIARMYVDKQM